jgi:hypothetical protein
MIAAICILAIGLSIIVLVTSQSSLADRDYITYWQADANCWPIKTLMICPHWQLWIARPAAAMAASPSLAVRQTRCISSCCWRSSVRGRAALFGSSR